MAKPIIHAKSSARKFKGKVGDYLPIHQQMDDSKSACGDNRHRVVFHSAYGCFIIERMFGIDFEALDELCNKHGLSDEAMNDILEWKEQCRVHGTEIKNSIGTTVRVRDIAEQHILEDFKNKYIPSLSDYTGLMKMDSWINNGAGDTAPQSQNNLKELKNID